MIKYICNKCEKVGDDINLNSVNNGQELCDDCLAEYNKKKKKILEEQEKKINQLNKQFKWKNITQNSHVGTEDTE